MKHMKVKSNITFVTPIRNIKGSMNNLNFSFIFCRTSKKFGWQIHWPFKLFQTFLRPEIMEGYIQKVWPLRNHILPKFLNAYWWLKHDKPIMKYQEQLTRSIHWDHHSFSTLSGSSYYVYLMQLPFHKWRSIK
jgi:hypothetical protein